MPETANYGFEYETPLTKPGITLTGDIDGSAPILAEQVDMTLAGIDSRLTGAEGTIAQLTETEAHDTGWLSLDSTPASGWAASISLYRQWGPIVGIRLQVQRTGSAITANASGNVVGDPLIVTINTAAARPDQVTVTLLHASVTSGAAIIDTNGQISLTDLNSNSSVGTDDYARVSHTYFVAGFN